MIVRRENLNQFYEYIFTPLCFFFTASASSLFKIVSITDSLYRDSASHGLARRGRYVRALHCRELIVSRTGTAWAVGYTAMLLECGNSLRLYYADEDQHAQPRSLLPRSGTGLRRKHELKEEVSQRGTVATVSPTGQRRLCLKRAFYYRAIILIRAL